jgi:hypothetical protein
LDSTKRATNDYGVASAFVEVEAMPAKDVILHFRADDSGNGSLVINGFEIDTADPHKKAIKPLPANDDEHVPPDSSLAWTAAPGATAHQLYFGTDSNAVACATPTSPEFKGDLKQTSFQSSSPQHSPLKPSLTYFWRVDEVHGGGSQPIKGEVWRFRPRSRAFPTAEGYGRFARGGRGGKVIEVTNLEDYDTTKGDAVIPGSFRAAVESDGPRTIVFRVSGLIKLKRPCAVTKPYCTIAGQTAPGDGICLANYSSGAFGRHDVIIRFLRFRIGDAARKDLDGDGYTNLEEYLNGTDPTKFIDYSKPENNVNTLK